MSTRLDVLFEFRIETLPLLHRGKVWDVHAVGVDHLLMVATDRLLAFDVMLPMPISGKARLPSALSNFWFEWFGAVMSHLQSVTGKGA